MMKRSTKSALLSAVLALAICFTALIGTTFAWFTDSVTSANNIIKAGNLDIELKYWNGTEYTPVTNTTKLFDDAALWEPGHTEVAYLEISNVGTLDLKYQLNVNVVNEIIGTNVNGDELELSDYLVFSVVDKKIASEADLYTREGAVEAAGNTMGLKTYNSPTTALKSGDAPHYVALIIYMPTNVGNEANHNGTNVPSIEMGVNLFATQLTSEEDSFGPDYDADATIESTPVAIPTEDVTAPVTLTATDVVVEVPAAVINALPAEVTSIALNYTAPQVDATTNTVSFAFVEIVDQNGNKIDLSNNTTPVAVTLPAQTAIAANEDVVVLHDGEVVASATVAADGSIAYTANHFCEVTVVAVTKVATADELKAAVAAGENVQFTADITMSAKLNITADTVIFGMGKTLTYTGSDRAIDVPANANAKVNVTLDNLTVDCTASYCERGVNYNDNGALTLNEVTVRGTNVTYALNLPGSSDDAIVVINDCALTGNIALNVWGENVTITANNTVFTSVDKTADENYSAIVLNNDGTTVANGTVIYVNGGKIIARDEKGEFSGAVRNGTATGKVEISDSTEVIGNSNRPVAIVDYGTTQFYSTTTLQAAIDKAIETKGNVKLTANIVLDKPIVVDGTVAIDLNGYTITYNSTTQGEAMITNKGNLTINDTVGSGVINYNYTGAADPSYGKGNYTISNQGTLTVNGGKITIANLSGHAKYPIDNNSTTGDAVLVINGGHLYNYNTSAIRQFCNSTTYKNSVTINGGLVEGYCAVWMQNPGKNTVNVSLTITGGEIKSTAKAYVNGTAELEDVSSAIYCTISGNGGAWSTDSFVSITGGIINENVYLAEDAPANVTVEGATFNGYVEKK